MKISDFFDLSISEFCMAQKYIAEAKDYPMPNEKRRHHGFVYTFTGTETYNFKNCSIKAQPNTLVYLPKGRQYKITFEGEVSTVITLDFEIHEDTDIAPFVLSLESNNPVQTLFLKAENEWQSKKTACRAACLSLLYKVISTGARIEERFIHPGKYEKIRESVEYLHNHYTEQDFRIESLSEMCGINSAYYARLFSDKFSQSPKEYVTELKMQKARELLSGEKYSISEIGSELGYSDVYHFSKSFKKATGISPTEWRKSNIK